MENPLEHETLAVACHVGFQRGLLIHLNFLGTLGPQAVVESEVG